MSQEMNSCGGGSFSFYPSQNINSNLNQKFKYFLGVCDNGLEKASSQMFGA